MFIFVKNDIESNVSRVGLMKKRICIITSSYPRFKKDSTDAGVFVKEFALLLKKENYGYFSEKTSEKSIRKFIDDINNKNIKLKQWKKHNNNEALKKIGQKIKLVS